MARNDGRLEPGQRLDRAISARAWNRMLDAADTVLGGQLGFDAGPPATGVVPYSWVLARPGSDIPRWGAVSITGLYVAPLSDASSNATLTFERQPVVTAITPTQSSIDSEKPIGIAVEPIKQNSIGRVAIAGVVQAKIDVTLSAYRYCHAQPGSNRLVTDASGEAQILWADGEDDSEDKWALLRLGGNRLRMVRGTFEAPWTKDTDSTVADANIDGAEYEATNYFASIGGSGTKRCLIAWVAGEWILLAAEC